MLILGSSSKARKALLITAGLFPVKILHPDINETIFKNEKPLDYVKRMAVGKSLELKTKPEQYLITADTIVTVGDKILAKTKDPTIAKSYLEKLSNRRHNVFTTFCVKHNKLIRTFTVKSILKMRSLTRTEIDCYILSNEWKGCAGAYKIQGSAIKFFPFISGCYSNIIGLPIPKLLNVLKSMNFFQDK